MKKIITLVIATFAILFSGCGASPKVEGAAGVEKMLPTYKIAAYVDADTAQSKLKANGFEVVGTYKNDVGTTILYTNDAMKADAAKPLRGFAAVGRILIDDERKVTHIANPVYFNVAFLQKDYNHVNAMATLEALKTAFGPTTNSEDVWEFEKLPDYHFMIGMPYYQEMDLVGEGTNEALLAKVKAAKGTVAVVQIGPDAHVAFIELDKRNSGFVKKVGTQNSEILPWAVLIEGGKARAMNAKYYIAISYPLLTMNEFMGIATMPDAITKNIQKIFK